MTDRISLRAYRKLLQISRNGLRPYEDQLNIEVTHNYFKWVDPVGASKTLVQVGGPVISEAAQKYLDRCKHAEELASVVMDAVIKSLTDDGKL
jgi:hypothetical protein